MVPGMDTAPLPDDRVPTKTLEAPADRQRRIASEVARIAEADADIAAGRLIDEADIDAWIDLAPAIDQAAPCRGGCAIPRAPAATSTRRGGGCRRSFVLRPLHDSRWQQSGPTSCVWRSESIGACASFPARVITGRRIA
jgi:hypothetical protein